MSTISRIDGEPSQFAGLTFRRLRSVLGTLDAPWFAVGATDAGAPVGLALGWLSPASEALLISVMVAAGWRRRGLGTALLREWQATALAQQAVALVARHSSRLPHRVVLERCLAKAGWSAPRMASLYMAGETGAMVTEVGRWPALAGRLLTLEGASFPSFQLRDDHDRAALDALVRQQLCLPTMDPKHYVANLDPVASLAVRREEVLVGWVLAQPVGNRKLPGVPAGRHCLYYASAYIDERMAPTGLLVAGYYHSYRRQAAHYGEGSVAALHSGLPRMQTMIRRRFGPIALCVEEVFESRQQPGGGSPG
ncbi:MAG: GNAT family N-acetyltransferase [Acetobacteraceae bacterium]